MHAPKPSALLACRPHASIVVCRDEDGPITYAEASAWRRTEFVYARLGAKMLARHFGGHWTAYQVLFVHMSDGIVAFAVEWGADGAAVWHSEAGTPEMAGTEPRRRGRSRFDALRKLVRVWSV